MIKISYKELNSEGLNQALAQLGSQSNFASFDAAYNVAKITKQFQENLEIAREMYAKWTKEFLVVDEAGKLKPATVPHPLCPWEIKEGMTEEFNKKMEEFLNTQAEINAMPLTPQALGNVKLSPHQILNLKPLFDSSVSQPESSAH